MQLKRPILVGGLGLSASLWLLNVVGHSPVGHAFGDGSLLLGMLALGVGGLWLRRKTPNATKPEAVLPIGPVDKSMVEEMLAGTNTIIETIITELSDDDRSDNEASAWAQIRQHQDALEQLRQSCDRENLTLAVVGNKSVGKTAVLSYLKAHWQSVAPSIYDIVEVNGEDSEPPVETDLVLFVTAADLTQSELRRIQSLLKAGYRLQIAFNKQDQLTTLDRQTVVEQIKARVGDLGIGVSAIAAAPKSIKVRRHQEGGEIEEFMEQPGPQLDSLTHKLNQLVESDAQQLVLATSLRQAKALKKESQQLLNIQRRQRAMPVLEQMQWIAAGSAFASPLPSLDLLASTAINAQLIVDLGAIYGQKFSLEQGKTAAATIAELLVKLGLVELSTQAFGSLLKVHAATYAVGGALQGVSAAYLTRMVGLSLIDFFEEQSLLPADKQQFAFATMGNKLQTIFKATKQSAGLDSFVTQALSHLPVLARPASDQEVPAPAQ